MYHHCASVATCTLKTTVHNQINFFCTDKSINPFSYQSLYSYSRTPMQLLFQLYRMYHNTVQYSTCTTLPYLILYDVYSIPTLSAARALMSHTVSIHSSTFFYIRLLNFGMLRYLYLYFYDYNKISAKLKVAPTSLPFLFQKIYIYNISFERRINNLLSLNEKRLFILRSNNFYFILSPRSFE